MIKEKRFNSLVELNEFVKDKYIDIISVQKFGFGDSLFYLAFYKEFTEKELFQTHCVNRTKSEPINKEMD